MKTVLTLLSTTSRQIAAGRAGFPEQLAASGRSADLRGPPGRPDRHDRASLLHLTAVYRRGQTVGLSIFGAEVTTGTWDVNRNYAKGTKICPKFW